MGGFQEFGAMVSNGYACSYMVQVTNWWQYRRRTVINRENRKRLGKDGVPELERGQRWRWGTAQCAYSPASVYTQLAASTLTVSC